MPESRDELQHMYQIDRPKFLMPSRPKHGPGKKLSRYMYSIKRTGG